MIAAIVALVLDDTIAIQIVHIANDWVANVAAPLNIQSVTAMNECRTLGDATNYGKMEPADYHDRIRSFEIVDEQG